VNYLLQPIWVDRDHKVENPLDEMLSRLDAGQSIIIFPEGTRGEPGEIQNFKTGIGRIVEARPSIPVVPVFLQGPERSLPKSAPFPLPIWNHVAVGLPQLFSGGAANAKELLRASIRDLAQTHSKGRHQRAPERPPAFTIAVLGIDGSGKSTLSRSLTERLSDSATACWISDKLELFENGKPKVMQPLLVERAREWIGRQAKQAKSLARYKIPKLAELLLRDRLRAETNRWYRPDVIVMDGCPLFNMTAWAALYREDHFNEEFCAKAVALMSSRGEGIQKGDPLLKQFPELVYLRRLGFDRLNIPDVVLFLDVAPEVAMRRIDARGEQKQIHETEEKLGRLREAYLLVCRVVEREGLAAVCRIDGAEQLTQVTADALEFVGQARSRGAEQ
jgi:adenylate kinase family enzyme